MKTSMKQVNEWPRKRERKLKVMFMFSSYILHYFIEHCIILVIEHTFMYAHQIVPQKIHARTFVFLQTQRYKL